MKTTLGCIRRADEDFGLFCEGDRVAVGVSGGKDSMLLLYALSLYRNFSHKQYDLIAINVNPGLGFDATPIAAFAEQLNVPFIQVPGHFLETAIECSQARGDATPCALCAKMRRGALNSAAKDAGCNKVALGHHRDDALSTFLMSMFYEGRLNTLQPRAYLSRTQLTVVRPMIYLREKDAIGDGNKSQIPVIPNPCPFDKLTNRQRMNDLMARLRREIPRADEMMFRALRHTDAYNLWDRYRVQPEKISHSLHEEG